MEKKYLFSPGPTMLPPEVLLKMAEPIMHHREPEFEKVMEEIRKGLKYLFQTKNEVMVFTSSGTGAMEGAVSNILAKGNKALVVRGGKFGERWGEICKAYGIEFVPVDVEWGKAVRPEQIRHALAENPSIRAVYTQATETSTGVKHPIQEIAGVVGKYPDISQQSPQSLGWDASLLSTFQWLGYRQHGWTDFRLRHVESAQV